jgi:protein-S-isoprenylcysteine O-methyltransferase Ste14
MSTPEVPDEKQSKRTGMPRWMALLVALIVWVAGVPLAHGVMPWAISLLTPRYGWAGGRPGTWNLLGLIPIIVGTACLVWIMVLHLARTPERVELEWTPQYLLRRGPYVFTRNPMYVAELALWLGWALLYGSVAVLIGFLLLVVVMNFRVVPREERVLEARFGETYRRYKDTVPRWLGKTRH